MSAIRGNSPLSYRRLHRAELDVIASLDLDPDHVERFLGPVADIMIAVRRGLAHSVIAIEVMGVFVGFYVIHPAPNDGSCWWLGWFAIDRMQQGHGYGSAAMRKILQHLETIPGCSRVRLLVSADNIRARRIYQQAGFRAVDRAVTTDELVLELVLPSHVTARELKSCTLYAAAVLARRVFCHRRLRLAVGPHPAWVIGVERGPPGRFAAARRVLHVEPFTYWGQRAPRRGHEAMFARSVSRNHRRAVGRDQGRQSRPRAPHHPGLGQSIPIPGGSVLERG
jgi:GNAT superfamily N-acetyltransferase